MGLRAARGVPGARHEMSDLQKHVRAYRHVLATFAAWRRNLCTGRTAANQVSALMCQTSVPDAEALHAACADERGEHACVGAMRCMDCMQLVRM